MKRSAILQTALGLITILGLAVGTLSPQPASASPSAQGHSNGVRYGYSDSTGKLTFVGAAPGQPIEVPGVSALGPDAQAMGIVAQYASAFGLSHPARELRVKSQKSEGNRSTTKYQQVYQGIPVMGGELVVNTTGQGYLTSMNGEVSPDLSLDTSVEISPEQARSIALEFMRKWYPDQQVEFQTTEPQQWIYDPRLLENRDGEIVLGWRMEVTAKGVALPIRELVLVDAVTGNVPLHFNQVDAEWQVENDPAPTDIPVETPFPTETQVAVDTPVPVETATESASPDGVSPLVATARYVSASGSDAGDCTISSAPCLTINYAIGQAIEGDMIYVAVGTYLGSGTNVVQISKNVTLSGGWQDGFGTQSSMSTIDGQNARLGITIDNSITAALDHFQIVNGHSGGYAGGIFNQGTLSLDNSVVSGNSADLYGGGIYSYGALTINNTTVSGNSAPYGGGGIYGSTIVLENTIVTGNSGDEGGGIYSAGTLSLENSTVSGNTGGHGGGIHNRGNATINNTAVNGNSSGAHGGIFHIDGTLTLNNTTVSGNQASAYEGGGISNYGTAILNNTTVSGNSAVGAGDGIYVSPFASLTVTNSIVAGNPADGDCFGPIASGGHNLIGNSSGCNFTPSSGDLIGTSVDPIYPYLTPLQDNGGPTLTHALIVGSPAIDAGDPASPGSGGTACLGTDQRGVARPVGAQCDIGASEGSVVAPIVITHTADHGWSLPGTFVCDQAMPDCTSGGDSHADKAHKYAIGTWNLYKNKHNRASIDDNNMPIISTVHYCSTNSCPYDNAFWSGAQMVYGDAHGFPNADDVVAHELTHGVTERESGLFYYMESGAINESLSDVWGEYYDQTNGLGTDNSTVKWKIGEDVTGLGALRSMSNPPGYGDPDRMLSSLFYKGTNDFGGVHRNSGVNNKAAYLMARSGTITFNGKTITGIGWTKTAAVYYEAQTHYLTTASDYLDLYNILYQSCLNLVGTKGITSANCTQVRNATLAVEMNKRPSGYRVQTGYCPAGTSKSADILYDGLESGTTKWSFTKQVGNQHWSRQDFYPIAGSYHLFGNDYDSSRGASQQRSRTAAQFKNGLAIPSTGTYYLHFKHAFEFETDGTKYYDGAVLEYTTNNGTTWTDAKALFNAGKGYGGTIFTYPSGNSTYGNPLSGRSAFVNTSNGYVSTRYKLSSLAGKTVKFRWVVGTDFTGWANLGWALDQVRVYKCQ